MSFLVDFSIIILSAIVYASLQLNMGGLLLLYHSSLGKHITKKTRALASNFTLGAMLMILLGLMTVAFVILGFFGGRLGLTEMSLMIGILFSLAILAWVFYYKTGKTTELWLPRSVTKFINERARKTGSRVEAFSLGMLTSLAEFPFSAVLVILAANAFLRLSPVLQIVAILVFTTIAVSPLILCRFFVRRGKTIVKIQKWRVKNKNFLRVFVGAGFFVLGIFLVAFKLMENL